MDQSEPQDMKNMHHWQLATLCQQRWHERQLKEAGDAVERVELRWQQATARQQHWCGRKNVADAAAQRTSDATAHQIMHQNQNDNEAIAWHAANAEQHHVQCQVEEAEVQDQHWQLDTQCHWLTESSQYAGRGILCDICKIDDANMVPMHHGWMDFVCTHCVAIGFRKKIVVHWAQSILV